MNANAHRDAQCCYGEPFVSRLDGRTYRPRFVECQAPLLTDARADDEELRRLDDAIDVAITRRALDLGDSAEHDRIHDLMRQYRVYHELRDIAKATVERERLEAEHAADIETMSNNLPLENES